MDSLLLANMIKVNQDEERATNERKSELYKYYDVKLKNGHEFAFYLEDKTEDKIFGRIITDVKSQYYCIERITIERISLIGVSI